MPKLQSHRVYFLLFLAALAALPPISIDMALPALSAIGRSLHASPSLTGLTLSLFMLGFAVTPVVLGPLSDRHGRRLCLMLGLVLFVAGGLLATFARSIDMLLVARLVQGAGAGSGMTLALAIARDTFEGRAAQMRLAVITVVVNVAPVIAPAIGATLLGSIGWRGIYAVTMGCGVVLALVVATSLTETRPAARNGARHAAQTTPAGQATHPHGTSAAPHASASLRAAYRRLFAHRGVLASILLNGLGFAWMFGYVAGSPLVLIDEYHVSPALYSAMFATTGLGIVLGATLNGKLAHRGVKSDALLFAAIVIAIAASAALTIALLTHTPPLPVTMALLVLCTFAFGLTAPSATHDALEPLPELAGVAGGLLTSVQMVSGALSSSIVAWLFPTLRAVAMSGTMLAMALLAAAILFARRAYARA